MSAPYTAVVIGCGFIGSLFNETPSYDPRHTHAASYMEHELTTLAGLCDAKAERVEAAARHWNVPAFTNVEAMLDKTRPALVSIASSTETHADILDAVLQSESVKAILCEKPITADLKTSKTLVEKARRNGVFLGINYGRRYNPDFIKIKEMLDRGALGDLRIVTCMYQKGVLNNASHFIDLFRFLIGEIVAVQAEPEKDAKYNSDLSFRIEFDKGGSAYFHGTYDAGDAFAEIDLIGTKGRIRSELTGHRIIHYDLEASPLFPGYLDFTDGKIISHGLIDFTYNPVCDLVECLQGKRKRPRCNGDDAVRALAVVDAAVRSAQTGKKIEVIQDG